uniref:Uncharacterized protein n=1 Tax=Rhizophora mucronata TaxID=61149 RepID=A0A2P2JBM9_RHIMU
MNFNILQKPSMDKKMAREINAYTYKGEAEIYTDHAYVLFLNVSFIEPPRKMC